MVILETTVFSRRVGALLDAESYRLLQLRLVTDPEAGDLIPGSGGLRKVRWQGAGRGKRGGVRLIYYWEGRKQVLLMLFIYKKNEQDALSPRQVKLLGEIVRRDFP